MIKILVIVEAEADFRIASCLADRVLVEKSLESGDDWVGDNLDHLREWIGFQPASSYSCWKEIKALRAQRRGIPRMLGHFRGEPLGSDGTIARLVALMAEQDIEQQPDLRALMFIRDLDVHSQKQERIESLNRIRDGFKDRFTILIGVADPKREAWVLNGFIPENSEELAKVEELQKELGFDPCIEAHRLRTVSRKVYQEQARNVKVVLDELIDGDFEREKRCWSETDLTLLFERGERTYLSHYLREIELLLLPLLGE